jgi:hypothetical protein
MFTQLLTSDAIAAEHRRELLAEAEAYRLAREATTGSDEAARSGRSVRPALPWLHRVRGRLASG